MKFLSSEFFIIFLAGFFTLSIFIFILQSVGMIAPIPPPVYKMTFGILFLMFFWWPIDMLIHWEKRTPTSIQKDQYLAMLALTVILFIYPYHWLETNFLPTLLGAVIFGTLIPIGLMWIDTLRRGRYLLSPDSVHRLAVHSSKAEEFLGYFPDARRYITGLAESDGAFAHCILHHRESSDAVAGGAIDFVLDIPVSREAKTYMAGKERLQCYLFTNRGDECRVGFLPAMNIGRVLDFGFSDEELERAQDEINRPNQDWKPLGDKPIQIENYKGKVVEIKQ